MVDRSVNYGWNMGPLYQEVLTALYFRKNHLPAISFIGGLSGADITVEKHFRRVIEITEKASKGDVKKETIWLNENEE